MSLLGQRDPRYRVIYLDGKRSERMDLRTARNYASIFDGRVICVEPRFLDFYSKRRRKILIDTREA